MANNIAKNLPVSKVLIIGAEVSPYASVGGQARVLTYLSKALMELGVDVRVFMPKFGFIDEKEYKTEMVYKNLAVPTGHVKNGPKDLVCNVKVSKIKNHAPTYFLENMEYYEKRTNVYGYSDDPIRWALLSRGVLEFLRKSNWVPDVIHANDWHTGLVPNFLKTVYEEDKILSKITSVFTIHNLSFQGNFDHKNVSEMDFDDGRSVVSAFFNKRLKMQNFMKRGIIYADAVNTVSETYSREILTPACGEGLDTLLMELRSKLFGIVNGIDYSEFDPKTDKLLAKNYDTSTLKSRCENKIALQKEFGLKEDESIPVLAYEGRLDSQKGLDLVFAILWPLLRDFDIQFVQVGGGSGHYVEVLKKLKAVFPEKVGIHPMPNFTLPRLIFSGADMILMPSKFEPCGIVQLEAMRYGCVPIVRATGGLGDTVSDFNPDTKEGAGFVFKNYDKWQFFAQVVRALETYRHKDVWRKVQLNAMKSDFSWENSAKKYLDFYGKAVYFHEQGKETISEGAV